MNCADILKWGIFDTRSLSSEERFANSLSMWFDFNKYASEAATKNAAAKAGIIIPEINIPVELDGSYGEGKQKYYSESLKYVLNSDQKWSRDFVEQNRIANGQIVDAWRGCTELSSKKGLAVIPTYNDLNEGAEININLQYSPVGAGVPLKIGIKAVNLPTHFKFRDYDNWPTDFVIDAANERNFVIVTTDNKPASLAGGFIEIVADVIGKDADPAAAGPITKSILLEKRVIEPEPKFVGPDVPDRKLMAAKESCQEMTIPASDTDRRIALSVVAQGNTGAGDFFGWINAFLFVNDKLVAQESGYGSANIGTSSSTKYVNVPRGRTIRVRAYATNSNCKETTGIQVYIAGDV